MRFANSLVSLAVTANDWQPQRKSGARTNDFTGLSHLGRVPAAAGIFAAAAFLATASAQAQHGSTVVTSVAGTVLQEPDPLPAAPPSRFNPDPGGSRNRGSSPSNYDDNGSSNLFARPLVPPPPPYGSEPLPRLLQLPRTGLSTNADLTLNLGYPHYRYGEAQSRSQPNAVPVLNRWRVPFGQYDRYADRGPETPYQYGSLRWFDPYKPSILKGDAPIIGQDIFLALTIQDQAFYEIRRIPVGTGASAARPGSFEFFGRSDSFTLFNDLSFTIELFKGETAFKPIDWAIRLTPVFNVNYSEFRETNVLDPDPRGPAFDGNRYPSATGVVINPADNLPFLTTQPNGLRRAPKDFDGTRYVRRTENFVSLEEAFLEFHIRDLSENYDFISTRIGSQLLNTDFRGFIFNDTNTAIRLFGNYANNKWNYNLAYFHQREKDTYSGLNRIRGRGQDVFVANLYRQDFFKYFLPESDEHALGFTMQWSFHANLDSGNIHYDRNAVIVRPAPIGQIAEHDVNAYYFGWAGDGHIGKWNVNYAFYQALGRDELNGIAGQAADINAQFFALEISQDRDWLRPKVSFLYASGDAHSRDDNATGFDAILDNPTFAGSPFSFYTRQGFGLANTAVATKQANSLLLDLRTSKIEGQSQFVNPGTLLFNIGIDAELTPRLKFQANANYIRFVNTDAIRELLFTDRVARDLGYDLSFGFTYRPTLTNNIIINAGFGAFLPQHGYRDIYRRISEPVPGFTTGERGKVDPVLFSGLVAITLTY